MRQVVQPGFQLSVCQPAVVAGERDRIGRSGRLPFEPLVQAQLLGVILIGPVPVIEHQSTLGLRQARQVGEASVRVVTDAF